jgi:hypothetical protein
LPRFPGEGAADRGQRSIGERPAARFASRRQRLDAEEQVLRIIARRPSPIGRLGGNTVGVLTKPVCCTRATFPLQMHLSVRISGEMGFHDCRKGQVGLNHVDQNVIQTHPKSVFASRPARPHPSNAAPAAGCRSMLRMLCRSKKLDKTSRLVRIQHRIF